MAAEYQRATGTVLTDKQLMKKLNNMKNEVKVKSDVSTTGNKPIKLKEWEQLLLDMMQKQNSSVISGVKGNKITNVHVKKICSLHFLMLDSLKKNISI